MNGIDPTWLVVISFVLVFGVLCVTVGLLPVSGVIDTGFLFGEPVDIKHLPPSS